MGNTVRYRVRKYEAFPTFNSQVARLVEMFEKFKSFLFEFSQPNFNSVAASSKSTNPRPFFSTLYLPQEDSLIA